MFPFRFVRTLFILALFAALSAPVSQAGGFFRKTPRVALIVVLDISGSMHGAPLDEAQRTLGKAMQELPKAVQTGLVAMGGCSSEYVRVMVPVGKNNHANVVAAASRAANQASSLNPGYAEDIYTALIKVESEMNRLPKNVCRKILILSDEAYTCSRAGEAPGIVKRIVGTTPEGGKNCNQVGVVSIGTPEWESKFFDEIAEAGRGTHVAASDSSDVDRAVREVLEQMSESEESAGGWSGDYTDRRRRDSTDDGRRARKPKPTETQEQDDKLEQENERERERNGKK